MTKVERLLGRNGAHALSEIIGLFLTAIAMRLIHQAVINLSGAQ